MRINMVPRHLPKKLLCVALIGTSILAILYYTAGLSNSSEHKFSHGNENSLEKEAKNVFDSARNKGASTSKNNLRIVPNPLNHFATSEKPSAAPVKNLNDDATNIHSTKDQQKCSLDPIMERLSDLDTTKIFPHLDFNASWIPRREYWSSQMQKRYQHRRTMWEKVPLKVILMPHSHNDPGWLKTYEGYFNSKTKDILNYAVDKLIQHEHMTFVWTEIAFLSMWYNEARSHRKDNLKTLIQEGRFEVLTGGWVMTDEANVHMYAMVDQMIEGHQWLLKTFGVKPKSSWSVDPFGHGGTFPYVLKASGVDKGMVIMRIHYAWKEYFAREQSGDFMWQQKWDQSSGGGNDGSRRKPGKHSILCHNFPYDIYSVKGSCGPSADVCVQFNFGVLGSQVNFNEYTRATRPITPANIKERSELILDQYGKTGSLYPHNVVLVPLGDDFMYYEESMWDSQYKHYQAIIDYINEHRDIYHTDIRFGTLSDYFDEVNARMKEDDLSTLGGDFFVYSDVFSEGIPAYWSGYFSTRPFMKQLSRELEANLRAAEILFTVGYQTSKINNDEAAINFFSNAYSSKLLPSRQNLALFQHHDAITGTSKQFVMHDYGLKMFDGIRATRSIQRHTIRFLMQGGSENSGSSFTEKGNMDLEDDFERANYNEQPKPLPLDVKSGDAYVVAFNSLANDIYEVVSFFVEDARIVTDLCIVDPNEQQGTKYLKYQVNPTQTTNDEGTMNLDTNFVEVIFVAKLPALSASKFKVFICGDEIDTKIYDGINNKIEATQKTKVYCLRCPRKGSEGSTLGINAFMVDKLPNDIIEIENQNFVLSFDVDTKLLKSIKNKKEGEENYKKVEIEFGGIPTQQFRNGAYLFSTDSRRSPNVDVFKDSDMIETVIVSGPIYSELSLHYQSGSVHPRGIFVHTVRLYHDHKGQIHAGDKKSNDTGTFSYSKGIYIENNFDFGDQDNHRDLDLFMRIDSKIMNNGPTFYTDQNGFQMQRRKKFSGLGIEGNVYPITTMTYIEDTNNRISLIVDHASAATSTKQGSLEVIVDRRATFDDARGMGEGILDSVDTVHKYWLLYETKSQNNQDKIKMPNIRHSKNKEQNEPTPKVYSHPTDLANFLSRRINYPTIQFMGKRVINRGRNKIRQKASTESLLKTQIRLLKSKSLPCNVHLFNLRTLSHDKFYTVPDSSALIILNKQSNGDEICNKDTFSCDTFNDKESRDSNKFNTIDFEISSPIRIKKFVRTTLTGNDVIEQPPLSHQVNEEYRNSKIDDIVEGNGRSSSGTNMTSHKFLTTLSDIDLETMALETFKIHF